MIEATLFPAVVLMVRSLRRITAVHDDPVIVEVNRAELSEPLHRSSSMSTSALRPLNRSRIESAEIPVPAAIVEANSGVSRTASGVSRGMLTAPGTVNSTVEGVTVGAAPEEPRVTVIERISWSV